MENLSKESIRKLRRLQKAILAETEFYAQSNFPMTTDCGAVCCLAGWAVWLDNPKGYAQKVKDVWTVWPSEASTALGVPSYLFREWGFFGTGAAWPQPFRDAMFDARTKRSKAKIAAALIDSFIEKDGVL